MEQVVNISFLTGESEDTNQKHVIKFFGKSPELGVVLIIIDNSKPLFLVNTDAALSILTMPFERKSVQLKSFSGHNVDAIYFQTLRDLQNAADILQSHGIPVYESDVKSHERYLMERFIKTGALICGTPEKSGNLTIFRNPKLKAEDVNNSYKIASIDIETGVTINKLFSIAAHITIEGEEISRIFMLAESYEELPDNLFLYPSQSELLQAFFQWFNEEDPDIIIGWHVIGFDLMYLEKKCQEFLIPFQMSRNNGSVSLGKTQTGGYFAKLSGRIVIDGPPTLRYGGHHFENFKLETVGQAVLGEGKIIAESNESKIAEIERQFTEDKPALAKYNLQDCLLVTKIFQKLNIFKELFSQAALAGLMPGQTALKALAFDHLYLPKLHRMGYAAPKISDLSGTGQKQSAEKCVLVPGTGIHENIVVLRFENLLAAIIATFKIDPVSRVLANIEPLELPGGLKFSRTQHILPNYLLNRLKQYRMLKKDKDDFKAKILQNHMLTYCDTMGNYSSRFYHFDLTMAISSSLKFILKEIVDALNTNEHEVVYADSDILFIKLKHDEAKISDIHGDILVDYIKDMLKTKLKKEFNLESYIHLTYHGFFSKLVIPKIGKNLCYGALNQQGQEKTLKMCGLESLRTDWTPLGKIFLKEFYSRYFTTEDITEWAESFIQKLKNGDFNHQLTYRKKLTKPVNEFTGTVPPHVKAAKLMNPIPTKGIISYIISENGPTPIDGEHLLKPDYQHYIDRQLAPIADSILEFEGKTFEKLFQAEQLNLFDF